MKVLQLIDSLEAGGAERMAVNIANIMVDHTQGSFLCATRAEGILFNAIDNRVGYLFLNKKSKLDVRAIRTLMRFVKDNNIDVIHAHSTSFFLATIIKMFNKNVKIVWHDHYGNSEFLQQRKHKVLKFCSIYFSHVISVNQILKQWSESHLNCKNVYYISNFVVNEKTNYEETQLEGEDGYRIVCLANLRPQKDHFTLLKAFSDILKEQSKWTLHLVGKDFEDDYSVKLKQAIQDLNLNTSVFIYGSKKDVQHILSQAEIGVLSSKSEGLPLSLLEYGLASLAVVATNVGNCAEVINNDKVGILVEAKNYVALKKGLLCYIENIEIRKKSASLLHQRIVSEFSSKQISKKLVDIYSNIKSKST